MLRSAFEWDGKSANGAIATSRMVANNVCFQAMATVVNIRDKAAQKHGRRFGNYVKTVLALLFAWGKERGYVAGNPAAGIKGIRRSKDAPDANRPWGDGEREAVLAA